MFFSKILFLFSCLLMVFQFAGCSQSDEDKVRDAILSANIYLNTRQCQEAIAALAEVGMQNTNSEYIQVLASAYACKAGYSEPTFFGNDIALVGDGDSVFGGFTLMTNASSMDAPDNDSYEYMQTAIDTLLYAGGLSLSKDPTSARRAAIFSTMATDINIQLVFMMMDQLGRYLYYYGDSSATGIKGSGDGDSECIVNYNNADVLTYLTTHSSGECDSGDPGHTQLGTTTLNIARLCQGVVLLNNILALLPAITAAVSGSDLDDIDITEELDTYMGFLEGAGFGATGVANVMSVLSQTKCVADNENDDTFLQAYFAYIFEQLFE